MEIAVNSIEQLPPTSPLGRKATIAVIGMGACLMAIDALTHAQPLVLPLISAALTVVGFSWAAMVTLRNSAQAPVNDQLLWPSLIVSFGFAAAMLSDSDQLVRHLQLS
jgi:uncharacterized membrane protein YkvI